MRPLEVYIADLVVYTADPEVYIPNREVYNTVGYLFLGHSPTTVNKYEKHGAGRARDTF